MKGPENLNHFLILIAFVLNLLCCVGLVLMLILPIGLHYVVRYGLYEPTISIHGPMQESARMVPIIGNQ